MSRLGGREEVNKHLKIMSAEDLQRNTLDITLTRGDKGLGFNIKGGVDVPHLTGDPGIFIAKVRERGAAADDGRIREGDKIIEINGVNVERVTHDEAVNHFMKAGTVVRLKVILGAEEIIKEMLAAQQKAAASDSSSGSSSLRVLLGVLTVAAVGVGIYMGWRHYKQ